MKEQDMMRKFDLIRDIQELDMVSGPSKRSMLMELVMASNEDGLVTLPKMRMAALWNWNLATVSKTLSDLIKLKLLEFIPSEDTTYYHVRGYHRLLVAEIVRLAALTRESKRHKSEAKLLADAASLKVKIARLEGELQRAQKKRDLFPAEVYESASACIAKNPRPTPKGPIPLRDLG